MEQNNWDILPKTEIKKSIHLHLSSKKLKSTRAFSLIKVDLNFSFWSSQQTFENAVTLQIQYLIKSLLLVLLK